MASVVSLESLFRQVIRSSSVQLVSIYLQTGFYGFTAVIGHEGALSAIRLVTDVGKSSR